MLLQIQGSEVRGTMLRKLEENVRAIVNYNIALYSGKGSASLAGQCTIYTQVKK